MGLCSLLGSTRAAENLLANPGFESSFAPAWEKRTPEDASRKLYRTDATARSGAWCAVLDNAQSAYTRLRQGHDRSIAIEVGSHIELSGWVKSELSGDGSAMLQFYCMGDKDEIRAQPTSRQLQGRCDWTRLRIRTRVSKGTAYCMAYLQIRDGVGKVFFDDIELRVRRKPTPPKPAPKVGLLTDLAEDDPCLHNLKVLLEDGLVLLQQEQAAEQLVDCVGAAVLVRSDVIPRMPFDSVLEFARSGRPVFMDMRNFAKWQGAEAPLICVAATDAGATWTFDGPEGEYDLVVHYADESDGAGHISVYQDTEIIGSWRLDATPEKSKDRPLTRTISGVRLRPGQKLCLRLVADRGEECRVDAIELKRAGGKSRRIEAESMALGDGVMVESPALMFAKGIKAAPRSSTRHSMLSGLRVIAESQVAAGFRAGQLMPRASHPAGLVRLLPKDFSKAGMEVLAVGPDGRPGVVRLPVGKGTVVAADVLSLREPFCRHIDAYYKYSVVTNALTNPVRFGEYYSKRMTYAELVERMKQTATAFPSIRLEDEGPACEDQRLYSLNLGKEGEPLYFLYAAAHGSEWEPGYGLLTFAKRVAQGQMADVIDLDRLSIKIIPILNPSGYDRFRRQNAHGVDLNRQGDCRWDSFKGRDSNKDGEYGPHDYDWKGASPFCEAEAKVYKRISDLPNLYCVLDFHGNSSATSNKVGILPHTAHEDNEDRACLMQEYVNARLRGRHLLKQFGEESHSQYLLDRVCLGGAVPYLMNTSAKGKFGILVELTAGYPSSYGTVLQTDVTCEVCRALFEAYGVRNP